MSEIIKCIIVDDEPIARDILENHLNKINSIETIASCKNAIEAFGILNNNKVDLIFLDINMPEISGLSFAKNISKDIKIIFTTAYREYAVEGFDLQAVDYLLKPISFERLQRAINKYKGDSNLIYNQKPKDITIEKNEFIFVRSERKMIKISFDMIKYIESFSDYLKIYLQDRTIITRETITSIEAKLPKNDFLRIHRSFIISLSAIESYTNEFIEIENKALPISRSYKKNVLNKLKGDKH